VLGWAFFRLTALLPERLRAWALHGTAETVRTLAGVAGAGGTTRVGVAAGKALGTAGRVSRSGRGRRR